MSPNAVGDLKEFRTEFGIMGRSESLLACRVPMCVSFLWVSCQISQSGQVMATVLSTARSPPHGRRLESLQQNHSWVTSTRGAPLRVLRTQCAIAFMKVVEVLYHARARTRCPGTGEIRRRCQKRLEEVEWDVCSAGWRVASDVGPMRS